MLHLCHISQHIQQSYQAKILKIYRNDISRRSQINPQPQLNYLRFQLNTSLCVNNSTVRISLEVSDDSCSHPLPTRSVSVAPLLRRYSPSPHPRLTLCSGVLSHVTALVFGDESFFILICFCLANVVNSTRRT